MKSKQELLPKFWQKEDNLELLINMMEKLRPRVIEKSEVVVDEQKNITQQQEWFVFLMRVEELFSEKEMISLSSFLRMYLNERDNLLAVFKRVDDEQRKRKVVGMMAVVLFLIGFDVPVPKELWYLVKEKAGNAEINLFTFHHPGKTSGENKKGGDKVKKFIKLDEKQKAMAAALMAYASSRAKQGNEQHSPRVEGYTTYEWAGKVNRKMIFFIIEYLGEKFLNIVMGENEMRSVLKQLEKVPSFIIKDRAGLWVNTQKELSRAVIVEDDSEGDSIKEAGREKLSGIKRRRGRAPIIRERIFSLLRRFFLSQPDKLQTNSSIERNGQVFYLLGKWGDFKEGLLRFLIDQGVRTSLTMVYQYLQWFLPIANDFIIKEGRQYFVAKICEDDYQQEEEIEKSEAVAEIIHPEIGRGEPGNKEKDSPTSEIVSIKEGGNDGRMAATIITFTQMPEDEFLTGLAQLVSLAAARLLEINRGKELAKELSYLFPKIVDLSSQQGEVVDE